MNVGKMWCENFSHYHVNFSFQSTSSNVDCASCFLFLSSFCVFRPRRLRVEQLLYMHSVFKFLSLSCAFTINSYLRLNSINSTVVAENKTEQSAGDDDEKYTAAFIAAAITKKLKKAKNCSAVYSRVETIDLD